MSKAHSPYESMPSKCFWRPAVAERHYFDITELSQPVVIQAEDAIATGGSCFAQHIGRHLRAHGSRYLDLEPAPSFIDPTHKKRFGYDIYSCRYGNIYTTKQLLQLAQEALGERNPKEIVWTRGNRFFDALRPSVDPVGHSSPDEVIGMRRLHLQAVAKMFEQLDVFVFTLGLTETWLSTNDGTAYPTAPGTVAGQYEKNSCKFYNARYPDIYSDLESFWTRLRSINSKAKLLLTVSPVPLNATATNDHVLVASMRSKSVLRAVVTDFVDDHADTYYFPSYEIISSHPTRGMFFEPDLRNVNDAGVNLVMKHFFHSLALGSISQINENEEIICDEAELDQFAK